MLGWFLSMTLTSFFWTLGEDAFEFLTNCKERFNNLGPAKLQGVHYINFQFDRVMKQQQRGYIDSGLIESPTMTWTLLFEAFLEKYIRQSMHKYLRYKFTKL